MVTATRQSPRPNPQRLRAARVGDEDLDVLARVARRGQSSADVSCSNGAEVHGVWLRPFCG